MLTDARELRSGTVLSTDLCVIGGGPAGITLAREFIGTPASICLVESGGLQADEDTQALYAARAIGLPYPAQRTRQRFFGGTSNHWGGWCRPLSPVDFDVRPWVPNSGWPITADELKLYYERAHTTCQLGPFDYERDSWTDPSSSVPVFGSEDVEIAIWQHSPVRFGRVYRQDLEQARNITVLLHANVTNLVPNEAVQQIDRVDVACLTGPRVQIRAKTFVLACGGIENARLLLNSDQQVPGGLGNRHDLVGRFFMDHPLIFVNEFVFAQPRLALDYYSDWTRPSLPVRAWNRGLRWIGLSTAPPPIARRGFRVTEDAQRRERILQWGGTLEVDGSEDASDFADSIGLVTRALETGSTESGPEVKRVRLWIRAEQAPNPASRVMLDPADRDALGVRKVVVDWRLTELDRRSVRQGMRLFGHAVGAGGLGRLRLSPALADDDLVWKGWLGQAHHMGTTRASDNPKEGVVDRNCRVHGLANLYIAGSSVFPSAGFSNPTLTIVALTHRLADHLKPLVQPTGS